MFQVQHPQLQIDPSQVSIGRRRFSQHKNVTSNQFSIGEPSSKPSYKPQPIPQSQPPYQIPPQARPQLVSQIQRLRNQIEKKSTQLWNLKQRSLKTEPRLEAPEVSRTMSQQPFSQIPKLDRHPPNDSKMRFIPTQRNYNPVVEQYGQNPLLQQPRYTKQHPMRVISNPITGMATNTLLKRKLAQYGEQAMNPLTRSWYQQYWQKMDERLEISRGLKGPPSSLNHYSFRIQCKPQPQVVKQNFQFKSPAQSVYISLDSKLIFRKAQTAYLKEHLDQRFTQFTDRENSEDREKYCKMQDYLESQVKQPEIQSSSQPVKFDSHFQCGNLFKVYKHQQREYVLLLQCDTQTFDYCHWYYFRCISSYLGPVRFHIVNIMRPEPLVLQGMKPLIWSQKNQSQVKGWVRSGYDLEFKQTQEFQCYLNDSKNGYSYYTFSFTYNFLHLQDSVYFAYSYPYTFSNLQDFLWKIQEKYPTKVRISSLTATLANNSCEYIIITNQINNYSLKSCQHTHKKAVVISGRVHPGETPASFAVEGFVNFILSNQSEAERLRNMYVFFVVPMLNPDGVRHGNYRCSLLGVDLNRRWIRPNKFMHPTIYYTKKLIKYIQKNHDVAMFCDFHAHSKLRGVFMYGCTRNKRDKQCKFQAKQAMIMPAIMAQSTPDFSYSLCHYKLEKSKESTARIVVFKQFGIVNSYTLELSLFSSDKNFSAFTQQNYRNIGKQIARASVNLASQANIQTSIGLLQEILAMTKNEKKPLLNATMVPEIRIKAPPRSVSIQQLAKTSFPKKQVIRSDKISSSDQAKLKPTGDQSVKSIMGSGSGSIFRSSSQYRLDRISCPFQLQSSVNMFFPSVLGNKSRQNLNRIKQKSEMMSKLNPRLIRYQKPRQKAVLPPISNPHFNLSQL